MEGGEGKNRRRKKRRRSQPPKEQSELVVQPKSKRRKGEEPALSTPSFLDKMRARLAGGHFRMLNEKLYTCSGNEAFNLFKKDPKLFELYHSGYQQQMSRWPQQPVEVIFKWLNNRSPSMIVADFGCGNACLAKSVKNKVFSIDLVSSDPSVIACDMSHKSSVTRLLSLKSDTTLGSSCIFTKFITTWRTQKQVLIGEKPEEKMIGDISILMDCVTLGDYFDGLTPLDSSSVDVAVFCLSLMGTNFPNYLLEANRVIKPRGWLLIAEVRSRFDPNNGGADPDKFSKAVNELGFSSVSKDFSNKMFVLFYFQKKEGRTSRFKDIEWPELKPCLYKRR